jgi:hypothetical protein
MHAKIFKLYLQLASRLSPYDLQLCRQQGDEKGLLVCLIRKVFASRHK